MSISKATITDISALVKLINSAYRGEASTKGWTTEAHLLKGDLRTDEIKPFPTDERFGVPTQALEFIVLEKRVSS